MQPCYSIKMALELVLKSLLGSAKFVNSSADEKDWVAIAKLIPGATPKQVCNLRHTSWQCFICVKQLKMNVNIKTWHCKLKFIYIQSF